MIIAQVFLIICAALCFVRAVQGPHLAHRLVAVNSSGLILFGLLLTLTTSLGPVVLDIALVYGVLMFANVVVISRYLPTGGDGKK